MITGIENAPAGVAAARDEVVRRGVGRHGVGGQGQGQLREVLVLQGSARADALAGVEGEQAVEQVHARCGQMGELLGEGRVVSESLRKVGGGESRGGGEGGLV